MSCQRTPLRRDGTSQNQRFAPALEEAYIQIDERQLEDFLQFVYDFAEEIVYYNSDNIAAGRWQPFFEELADHLPGIERRDDNLPHAALMIAFLRMLEVFKADLNALKLKHLLFYYQDVLRFRRRAPIPDQVHVLFQLAKTVERHHRLRAGASLRAGKDADGRELFYATNKEILINKASVADIKTILVDARNQQRIYAAPVANSLDGLGAPLPEDRPFWPTFGERQIGLAPEDRNMIDATVGFAIASPILLLQEGERTITLTLEFGNALPDNIDRLAALGSDSFMQGLRFFGSGVEDWVLLDLTSASLDAVNNTLEFELRLAPAAPAIVHYNQEALELPVATRFPVLKALLNPEADPYLYPLLRNLRLTGYRLHVDVRGVRNLILQNEYGLIDATQNYFPFGLQPGVGSHFYFGSYEVFQKELDSLVMHLHWANLPGELIPYEHTIGFNDYAIFSIRAEKNWNPAIQLSSFFQTHHDLAVRPEFTPYSHRLLINSSELHNFVPSSEIEKNLNIPDGFGREPQIEPFDRFGPNISRGFGRLTLVSEEFRAREHRFSIPYTPELQAFWLDYSSRIDIPFGAASPYEQFFHIEPFGSWAQDQARESAFLLPQYTQGTLYIGISDLAPPQNLNLLFQLLEGSADPDITVRRSDVRWHYLGRDAWLPFAGLSIQADTTWGLQTSGIIEYQVGKQAVLDHTVLPAGLHWLRATIDVDPAGINRAVGIHAQAMAATNESGEQAVVVAGQLLPPDSISKLAVREAAIKSVAQPYTSFGGRAAESDRDFLTRVSERLRHRQRAAAIWDCERMVLEAFPEVFKVKCLNHGSHDSEVAPGFVTLVLIPNLRNRNAVNPLQPRASSVLRDRVRVFMQPYLSFFTELRVENPHYEPVLLEMQVGLREGFDGGYYGALLDEELRRFLSPWAFGGEDIAFGGRIYTSHVLKFVEDRHYVDYVTGFRMFHLRPGLGIGSACIGTTFIVAGPHGGLEVTDFAEASTARSILVSAEHHHITILEPGEFPCAGSVRPRGIGAMIIRGDFIVA
jgi:hypothetical protein